MAEDEGGSSNDLRDRVDAEANSKVHALNLIRRQSSTTNLPSAEFESIDYTRVHIDRSHTIYDQDTATACQLLDKAMALRKKWQDNLCIIDPDEEADKLGKYSPPDSSNS
jgi:hypothetical protein